MEYACKNELLSQGLLLIFGLLLIVLIFFGLSRIKTALRLSTLVFVSGLIFTLAQILAVFAYWFQPGWDSGAIIYLAKEYALGLPLEAYSLSQYPNNTLITLVFAQFFRFALSFGLSEQIAYKSILVFLCLLSFAAGQLCFYSARLISGDDRASFLAFIVYLLLIGLSPWVSIPYSDSLALPFPILILTLYLRHSRDGRPLSLILMGFAACIGYCIKPTVAVVFIALCLYELLASLKNRAFRDPLRSLLLSLLGFALGLAVYTGIVSVSGIEIDREQTFGTAHFINMGLNEECMGVYSEEDAAFSRSFDSADERSAANLEMAKSRVEEMGFSRLVRHLVRKLLCTYNDGSFAWGKEGFFVVLEHEVTDPVLSPLIRSFYYPDGENLHLFLNFEQALWIAVLALCCLSSFCRPCKGLSVILFSLLGLLLYFLLFEVRARYLFIYAPFYLILASSSLCAFSGHVFRKTSHAARCSD